MPSIPSLEALIAAFELMPPGVLIPATEMQTILEKVSRTTPPLADTEIFHEAHTWRERLWTVAPETRLDIRELAEALNRSRSWITARLQPQPTSGTSPIPHRKLEGQLQFLAGEVKEWVLQQENVRCAAELE